MKPVWPLVALVPTKAPTGKTVSVLQCLMHGAQDCKQPSLSGASPTFDRRLQ